MNDSESGARRAPPRTSLALALIATVGSLAALAAAVHLTGARDAVGAPGMSMATARAAAPDRVRPEGPASVADSSVPDAATVFQRREVADETPAPTF